MNKNLLNRWTQLTASNNWNKQDAQEILARLSDLYNGSNRFYHNWAHIETCLSELDNIETTQSIEIELALWFHDAIYDTQKHDNEAASADLASQALDQLGVSGPVISEVKALIEITDHKTLPKSDSECLITDIDLSILASTQERYIEYTQQIRKEYHWVKEEDFKKGRKTVLQNFLDRSSIFHSNVFQQLEEVAQSNIAWELSLLD